MNSSKCSKLKRLITSEGISFLMEVHNGLSARIVEETGFQGGWISGLSVSAQAGVRDRNELSFKEVADFCYYICSRVEIPMLLDMDTGYGDYNTASVAVKMLEKSGVAGVCIEDKKFPKHNSFLSTSGNDLEDPYIFAGKIRALHDATEDPDFVVIARLEGFISGLGLEETYRRACIYEDAGANAILVHSKKSTCEEIDQFMKVWNENGHRTPIVIVPTKYYKTPTSHFEEIGISTVIWANHNLRSSIQAMKSTSRKIFNSQSLEGVETGIATVSEVFRLQRDDELAEKEMEYVPTNHGTSIILSGASNVVDGHKVPKCLTPIRKNETILDRLLRGLKSIGITNNKVVFGDGFDEEMLDNPSYEVLYSPSWKGTTEVTSLFIGCISDNITLPLFVVYGDLVFKDQVFQKLAYTSEDNDIVLGVDFRYNPDKYNEFVSGTAEYSRFSSTDLFGVTGCSDSLFDNDLVGSFVGILKVTTARGLGCLISALASTSQYDPSARFHKVIQRLSNTCKVKGMFISEDEWFDINTLGDMMEVRADD